jgi:hypothetical protein
MMPYLCRIPEIFRELYTSTNDFFALVRYTSYKSDSRSELCYFIIIIIIIIISSSSSSSSSSSGGIGIIGAGIATG